ncbi:MAG TPA: hypothetical protein VK507_09655, partial [Iamia sp.]|nr:hypothetical protein [Iamia sp.]
MHTRSVRGLAACLLLPLALLACSGADAAEKTTDMFGQDIDDTGDPGTSAAEEDTSASRLALPDICTLVPEDRVEAIMGGPVTETVPGELTGGERFGGSRF